MSFRAGFLALALTLPLAAGATPPQDRPGGQGQQGQMPQGQQAQQGQMAQQGEAALLKTPPSSVLIGTAIVDEIRAFPEMSGKGQARDKKVEKLVGIEGIDRVFQTDKSMNETAMFFDQQFKQTGHEVLGRVESTHALSWTVKRPDGTVANIVVRNTRPTTFEIVEVSAATGRMEMQR
jgi:hypothetical protein